MIAIVGAGLTGLALSRELDGLGAEHVVVEASERPGGVIRSGVVDGHLLEWGPQRARLTAELRSLIEELGLSRDVITAPTGLPLCVFAGGRLRRVPFSLSDLVATDLLSIRAKIRLLLEPFTSAVRDDESVASALSRKLGGEAYENLAGPLYGGLYGSDPADMLVGLSLAHTLREMRVGRSLAWPLLRRAGGVNPPPAISFSGGLQVLTDALHARMAAHVRLGERAVEMRGSGDRIVLSTGERQIAADQVVLTPAAVETAKLIRGLDAGVADRIARLRYNLLAVVHLTSPADLRGLGYQVGLGESLSTRGVTFNHAMFGRESVYTAYLGGAHAPRIVDGSDDAVAETAVREFRLATGFDSAPISVARVAMPAWDASWRSIQGLRLPRGVRIAANWWSRPGIPGRLAEAKRLAGELAAQPT